MDPQMVDTGRQLEMQVAGVMQLLDAVQDDLAQIADQPQFQQVARDLSQRRQALAATIAMLQQGQAALERRLEAYAEQVASREAALERARLRMSTLTRRIVQVQEDERRALARDLHDTSSGAITAIGLGLSVLKREGGCSEAILGRIQELQRIVSTVSEDLHRLSANLRPTSLDRYGLVPAAEELVTSLRKQTGAEVDFRVEGLSERLPGDVETALYRIIQEACTNIARHAAAAHASVSIRRENGTVQVLVHDDGKGFDLEDALARGRLGIVGMRERAEMLAGAFTIDTRPGCGVDLSIEVPVAGTSSEQGLDAGGSHQAVEPVDAIASSEGVELARARALSNALVQITDGMSRRRNAPDLLAFVLARAAATVDCDYAVVALLKRHRWIVSHAYGLPESMIGQRLLSAALPLALEIERTSDVVVVNYTGSDDPLALAARESGVFSGAGIPLVAAGRFLGAVAFVHNSAPISFKPSEVEFLRHLCSVISLVLEIIQLRGEAPPIQEAVL